jgi:hypothetical protein
MSIIFFFFLFIRLFTSFLGSCLMLGIGLSLFPCPNL